MKVLGKSSPLLSSVRPVLSPESMATVAERRIGAVIGSLVADAAVQPIHWNYNKEKLTALLSTRSDWEFWEPSQNPFYVQKTGKQTCYGDQNFVVLKSLVENSGINSDHLKKSLFEYFGAGTAYDNPIWSGGPKTLPINGCWRNGSIRDFLKNYEEKKQETGSESDEQVDCVLRIIPVAALYAGHPQLLDKVEEVVRLTQNNDVAVAFGLLAARLLEIYILNGPTADAIGQLRAKLTDPKRSSPKQLTFALCFPSRPTWVAV
ncbi:Hypothetical predicted protein [Octopus vulgaris]|uniref:Crystallin J1A n=1 Tax=Octopus vulgaris TaxID=6645 RepID=A0AA36AXU1_OCTVU|nr:Hypothetical predicted protein [Octopus vulgaris]